MLPGFHSGEDEGVCGLAGPLAAEAATMIWPYSPRPRGTGFSREGVIAEGMR